MTNEQLGAIVDELIAQSKIHNTAVKPGMDGDNYVYHMTSSAVLNGLALAFVRAREITPLSRGPMIDGYDVEQLRDQLSRILDRQDGKHA